MAPSDFVTLDKQMEGNEDMTVGAYEAKRLQRIQQNQQMLESLGIALPPRERKRQISTRDDAVVPVAPVAPRRSARLQQDPVATTTTLHDLHFLPRRVRSGRIPEFTPMDLPSVNESQPPQKKRFTRKSSKELNLDMTAFHDRWLGKQIWPKGKYTVMEGMCPRHIPVFSVISGIQQWLNGMVLFVNVHAASGYENSFTEVFSAQQTEPTAVHFRWFASERQRETTPSIARLLTAQHGNRDLWLDGAVLPPLLPEPSDKSSKKKSDPVLLFVRHIDGPYIYCGRLGYLGHRTNVQPIEFRWQLLDFDRIQWTQIKQLLDTADHQADADKAVVETSATET